MSEKKKEELLKRINNAKNSSDRINYKRLWISGNGQDHQLRLLSTEYIDEQARPFSKVWLHGGFFHPNYDNKYPSTFRCIGFKKCPLCAKVIEVNKSKKGINKANFNEEQKNNWKRNSNRYTLYWAVNMANNELSLVHVPDFTYSYSKDADENPPTLHELIEDKLIELAGKGIDPLDFEKGRNLVITQRKVKNETIYEVSFEDEVSPVSKDIVNKMKKVKKLQDCYPKKDVEELQSIADGQKILKGAEADTEQKNKEKEEVSQKEEEIQETHFEEFDDASDLLAGDDFPDDLYADDEAMEASEYQDQMLEKLNNINFDSDEPEDLDVKEEDKE